jgi:hypothetical protein
MDMDGGTDAGPSNPCPPGAPDRDELMGACCYRVTNSTRQDAPELRLASLDITSPSSLDNVIVAGLLTPALDEERFNWLVRLAITGTDVSAEMGYGHRNPDGSFTFLNGEAPGTDPNRWDPVTIAGSLDGENVTAPAIDGAMVLPVFDSEGNPTLELPLSNLALEKMVLSEDRSCVGARTGSVYNSMDGQVSGFIRVTDAQGIPITELSTTLCNFVAKLGEGEDCGATAQASWMVKPDSICDTTTCSTGTGACDPDSDCNAWQIQAGFAAQGVEITD